MVKVNSTHTVKPADPTPNEIMYLSELDQMKAVTHVPIVYFYTPPTDFLYSDAIKILKDSLSKVLVLFYPLAGSLHKISSGRLELHCDATGATLAEAESESTFEDYASHGFVPDASMGHLILKIDYSAIPIEKQPLLLAQLTRFSCGGICLGLGFSHVLVDGPAAMHFVSEWSRIARGEKTGVVPFLDRRILRVEGPPKFEHTALASRPPLVIGQSVTTEERKKPTTFAMLKLNKQQIDKLKAKANEDNPYKNTTRPYSRYEAVAGHMWRCASKARKHAGEQVTRLHMPVDFRNRMRPALTQGYFGNAGLRQATTTTVGELLSKPLSYASSKIREAVEQVTDEYVRSYLALIKDLPDVSVHRNYHYHTVGHGLGGFFGNPNMEITSWTLMDIYGANFGWGKVIHMGPGAIGFDGKSFILPGRDGSFTASFCLQAEYMDTFKELFYQETECVIRYRTKL